MQRRLELAAIDENVTTLMLMLEGCTKPTLGVFSLHARRVFKDIRLQDCHKPAIDVQYDTMHTCSVIKHSHLQDCQKATLNYKSPNLSFLV